MTTAWPDSLMKRCGYGEEHLMGAATTAIINTRNGNWHEVRVCHFQCTVKTRILSANHNRTFHGHTRLQQQQNAINFHFLFVPPVCHQPFFRTYIIWSIKDETRFYVCTELHKLVNYHHLNLNLWSYKYCGIRKAYLFSSRHWFGQPQSRLRCALFKE